MILFHVTLLEIKLNNTIKGHQLLQKQESEYGKPNMESLEDVALG